MIYMFSLMIQETRNENIGQNVLAKLSGHQVTHMVAFYTTM